MRKASFAAEQASPIEHISRSVVDGVLNDASGLSCWPRPGVPVSCLLHFDLYLVSSEQHHSTPSPGRCVCIAHNQRQ